MRKQKSIPLFVLAASMLLVGACTRTTDAGITGTVKTKLAADDQVKASEINVDTSAGVVTLTGSVDSEAARDRAVQLAKATSGVRDVKDMISVREGAHDGDAPDPSRTVGERIDDATITMKVKAKLLEDPLVKGLKIDVDTRDGVVYLTGTVRSDAERTQAIQIARTTEGVKNVEANLG
jgi:hyperosmotically inducible periplasmic protein